MTPCDCGRTDYVVKRLVGENWRCDLCAGVASTPVYDVYFDGPGHVEHLADPGDPKTWQKGVYVSSKREKAEIMKKLGVREAGDKVGGARSFDPVAYRHARESLCRAR